MNNKMYMQGKNKNSKKQNNETVNNSKFMESSLTKNENPLRDVKYFIFTCSDCDFDIKNVLGIDINEVFIYRNIGNIIKENDENFFLGLKYAIENYGIKYFLIIGHYFCDSFKDAIYPKKGGFKNMWFKNIKEIAENNKDMIRASKKDNKEYEKSYCEVNIKEQILRLGESEIFQEYIGQGKRIYIVGLTYNEIKGELKEIEIINS